MSPKKQVRAIVVEKGRLKPSVPMERIRRRVYGWGGCQVAAASNLDRQLCKTLDCMHEAQRILIV